MAGLAGCGSKKGKRLREIYRGKKRHVRRSVMKNSLENMSLRNLKRRTPIAGKKTNVLAENSEKGLIAMILVYKGRTMKCPIRNIRM